MLWKSDEPDPLEVRRRKLADQQRKLNLKAQQLKETLTSGPDGKPKKQKEPPVWRLEDDVIEARAAEPTPARKRNLARQRRRDMVLFFACIALFFVVLVLMLWVAYVHNVAPPTAG